ncbi:MAG: GEVED domain-containing protein [Candidatus Krumholzibacteriota bacterium]
MRKRLLWLMAGMLLLPVSSVLGDWDPGMPAKWIQLPDLDITGIDINASPWPDEFILADDFECTEQGYLTEIHLFGSWLDDSTPAGDPGQVMFTLSIHADIPADQSPTGFSMPGEVLWIRDFQAHDFMVRPYMEHIEEGWMNPPDEYTFPADFTCWQYNFHIPEEEAFLQEGAPGAPIVYWLDVKAVPEDGASLFGWKTSLDHWNDDAVWGRGAEPYLGPWEELIYPPGHQFGGQSIDLAFVLNGVPVVEDLDFGDAPDTYRTLLATSGPHHVISPLFLGALIDAEPDGLPHPQALGDDFNNQPDEDGVILMSPMISGQLAHLGVTASQPGLLDAWIDFDGSGNFVGAGEQIFASQALNAGLNPLTFMVPAGTPGGVATIGRFRLSSAGGLTYAGPAPDGEVEDHEFVIEEEVGYKWFQKPDLDPTGIDVNASHVPEDHILADDFLCTERGRLIEIHVFGSWLHDLLPGGDPGLVNFNLSIHADIPAEQNPDGYSIPGELLWLMEFQPGTFDVRPYAEGIEEGWMDPPEHYIPPPADTICWQYRFYIDAALAFLQEGTPANPVVYWLDLEATPLDDTGPLFGWKTSLDHWNDDAVWGIGVEPHPGPWWELRYPPGHPMMPESIDLAFGLVSEPAPLELDWGDASDPSYPTLLASNGPRHQLSPFYLGTLIDADPDGQPTANAMGDDLDGNDDEDGVTFTSPIQPAQPATVDIVATQPGHIDAWIDFNGNGSFADPGEQIFVSLPLNAGLTNLTFNVPGSIAENTNTTARFRASTNGGLAYDGVYPDGTIPDGEVEDYEVFLEDRYTFKWIQNPDLSTQGIDVAAYKKTYLPDGFLLADDFLCTTTGPVTDIHVWGSWFNDVLPFDDPGQVRFTLSMHADIPADVSPTGYSMPGEVLWLWDWHPGEYVVEPFAEQIEEGFMYPPGDYFFPADWTCWLYKFHVDPHFAFIQEGTELDPVVYWLDVQAEPMDDIAEFGWKTSVDHWNDDAVWAWGSEGWPGPWNELVYPPGHQLAGLSIDLAFALFEDFVTPVPDDVPLKTGLRGNIPNPFNPSTVIHYVMPEGGGEVKLEVFDARGRLVRTLIDGFVDGGAREVTWYGRDNRGVDMPSGVYFYRLVLPDGDEAMKMLLLR